MRALTIILAENVGLVKGNYVVNGYFADCGVAFDGRFCGGGVPGFAARNAEREAWIKTTIKINADSWVLLRVFPSGYAAYRLLYSDKFHRFDYRV
jgi:hypothetical protein